MKVGRDWVVDEADLAIIEALPRRRREYRTHQADGGRMLRLATTTRDPSRPGWSLRAYQCQTCGATEYVDAQEPTPTKSG